MADISPSTSAEQVLRYAHELHRLHEVERDTQNHLEAAQNALAQVHQQQLALVADLRSIYKAERQARKELNESYIATIKVLAAAVEARDDYTGGHVERVRSYSVAIGRELGLDDEAMRALDVGAILHDVGKVAVSDAVLVKPGPLDPAEWTEMRQHPAIGARLLQNVPFLIPAIEVVANHHERWDGGGYPLGLSGETIPLAGRIVALADAFDALTTDRVYRQRRSLVAALDEILTCSGTQFDPKVVEMFMRAYRGGRLSTEAL